MLLDMTKHYKQTPVKPGTAFNKADIEAAAKATGVTIGKGDVVLFHTGWMATAAIDPKKFINEQPGLGKEGAEYLASLGVVMIGYRCLISSSTVPPGYGRTAPSSVRRTPRSPPR